MRTALIGLTPPGRLLLEVAAQQPEFKLVAVADRNLAPARSAAEAYGVAAYDDYRRLLAQEKPEVLLLAAPTFACAEVIPAAAKLGVHIYKLAPLGRNVAEAAHWVEAQARAGRHFMVGGTRRFAPGYRQAREVIAAGEIGTAYLARGEKFGDITGEFGWRGDPVLAGGGVLLEAGYQVLDQILANFSVPERIYCLQGDFNSKRVLPPSRTEDTAVLLLEFPGKTGLLSCGWFSGPAHEQIVVHGTEGTLEAGVDFLRQYDRAGALTREEKFAVTDKDLCRAEIEHFAAWIHNPELKPASAARDHLANVAVIETAYLAQRTQLPESLKFRGSVRELDFGW